MVVQATESFRALPALKRTEVDASIWICSPVRGLRPVEALRFTVSTRAASEGRNPRTGEKIQIAASKQPKFKAGKGLKDAVN